MGRLKACLSAIANESIGDSELGVEIIAAATGASKAEAQAWVRQFGNPLIDEQAGAVLAVMLGLDAEVLEATCEEKLHNLCGKPEFSRAMTRIILEAVVAVGSPDIPYQ